MESASTRMRHGFMREIEDMGPVAYSASSDMKISALVEKASRISGKGKFLLLLANDQRIAKRLVPALLNAALRQDEGEMRSRSLALEILLFVSGTMRIDKAIEKAGAADSSAFIIFGNDKETILKFSKENKVELGEELNTILDLESAAEVSSAAFIGE